MVRGVVVCHLQVRVDDVADLVDVQQATEGAAVMQRARDERTVGHVAGHSPLHMGWQEGRHSSSRAGGPCVRGEGKVRRIARA